VFHLIDGLNNWVEAEKTVEEKQTKMTSSSRPAPKKRSAVITFLILFYFILI
jgi:hypothetical protein